MLTAFHISYVVTHAIDLMGAGGYGSVKDLDKLVPVFDIILLLL